MSLALLGTPIAPLAVASPAKMLLREDFHSDASSALPKGWEEIRFESIATPSRYRSGPQGLEAQASAGASLLAREISFPACPATWIRWSWQVERVPAGSGGDGKSGDDYAARLAVVFAYDPALYTWWERLLRALGQQRLGRKLPGAALEYVWNEQLPPGTMWPNPYTDKAMMVALGGERGRAEAYERDLCADYHRAFGRAAPTATALFVMTDADDTGDRAEAIYEWVEVTAPSDDPTPATGP